MSQSQIKTFLITGVSTGLGRAFAEVALREGHRVVGTVRHEDAAKSFEALAPGRAFARQLDVTETATIAPLVADIEAHVGPIDVLINNAGYGHEGVLEEASLDDLRRQFEVNVFGVVAVIQAVLPYMRKRRAGRILNITSMGGIITMPGISFYHGSKFALEGISESLAKEVHSLGIYVTAVEPGGFRTDWAGRSMVRSDRHIADYDAVFDPLRERRKNFSGNQPGDPHKAGEALLKLIASDDPPMHLLLGRDAMNMVREKLGLLKSEFDAWEQVTLSTDFS
ncbi:oxidoreductase [Dyella sp. GSA-30]|uniref:oxidoreductase n=1 Tax=Dyella sp. GSA-30 TaxID=2994496 RepID=UPI002490A119|nr:oxidoreductase [Dyella sp. GSA-30]BDU21380.1 short-chain dehydrogenase/reductase [Dyella sp. GSA-30]